MINNLKTISFSFGTKTLVALWLVYFLPYQTDIALLGILVFIDTFVGALNAAKNGYFNSRRLLKAAYKVLLYIILILSTLIFEKIIAAYYSTTMITLFVIAILAATELFSILENLSAMGVPIPDIFNTFFKDLKNKEVKDLLTNQQAKRRISRNIEILLNKYLMLIHSEDSRQLLSIKFMLWNKYIIEPIINNNIVNITSFKNKYNLMILEAKDQLRNIVGHHKNLEDEFQRFGKFSNDQIELLKHNVDIMLNNKLIEMPKKNIAIAELHVDLLYKTFNEVLVLESHLTSAKEYKNLK